MNQLSLSCEGEPIAALLHEPRGNARNAAVVVAPSRVTTVEEMAWLAAPLAESGFNVLVQGYRPGAVRYQLRDVANVRQAVSWLRERLLACVLRPETYASGALSRCVRRSTSLAI